MTKKTVLLILAMLAIAGSLPSMAASAKGGKGGAQVSTSSGAKNTGRMKNAGESAQSEQKEQQARERKREQYQEWIKALEQEMAGAGIPNRLGEALASEAFAALGRRLAEAYRVEGCEERLRLALQTGCSLEEAVDRL